MPILYLLPKQTVFFLVVLVLAISGCATPESGTSNKALGLNSDYKYHIGLITDSTDGASSVDTVRLMGSALHEALVNKNLLMGTNSTDDHYVLSIEILDYDMGDAFTRWLLPGYGSVVLGIRTDVIDSATGDVITTIDHKQTIAGNAYFETTGAWAEVFTTVANDISTDLERKFSGGGFFISLNPWLENEAEAPQASKSSEIKLLSFEDQRQDKDRIGERQAAFSVSMGNVYANRDVAAYITEAMQNELLASGNRITDNPDIITISGSLKKFWIRTDTTITYWDIVGEIQVEVIVTPSDGNQPIQKLYSGEGKVRTYKWPTEKLVEDAMTEALRTVMYQVRQDSIWFEL